MGSASFSKVLIYAILFAVFLGIFVSGLGLLFQYAGLSFQFQKPLVLFGIVLFIALALRLAGNREPENGTYAGPTPMPVIDRADILLVDKNASSNSPLDVFGSLILTREWLVFTGIPIAIKTGDIAVAKKEIFSPLTKWLVYAGKDLLMISMMHNEKYSFYVHKADRWVDELNKIRNR